MLDYGFAFSTTLYHCFQKEEPIKYVKHFITRVTFLTAGELIYFGGHKTVVFIRKINTFLLILRSNICKDHKFVK